MLGEVLPRAHARSATVLRCALLAATILMMPFAVTVVQAQSPAAVVDDAHRYVSPLDRLPLPGGNEAAIAVFE